MGVSLCGRVHACGRACMCCITSEHTYYFMSAGEILIFLFCNISLCICLSVCLYISLWVRPWMVNTERISLWIW